MSISARFMTVAATVTLLPLMAAHCPPTEKPGCLITLYHDANFGGGNAVLDTNFGDLKGTAVWRQVSSFKVSKGTWELFLDEGFGKPYGKFSKGEQQNQTSPNDEIDGGRCTPN